MVKAIETRKHSSRMCTAHLPYRVVLPGGRGVEMGSSFEQ